MREAGCDRFGIGVASVRKNPVGIGVRSCG